MSSEIYSPDEEVTVHRRADSPRDAFRSLLDIAVRATPVTYNMLIRPEQRS